MLPKIIRHVTSTPGQAKIVGHMICNWLFWVIDTFSKSNFISCIPHRINGPGIVCKPTPPTLWSSVHFQSCLLWMKEKKETKRRETTKGEQQTAKCHYKNLFRQMLSPFSLHLQEVGPVELSVFLAFGKKCYVISSDLHKMVILIVEIEGLLSSWRGDHF